MEIITENFLLRSTFARPNRRFIARAKFNSLLGGFLVALLLLTALGWIFLPLLLSAFSAQYFLLAESGPLFWGGENPSLWQWASYIFVEFNFLLLPGCKWLNETVLVQRESLTNEIKRAPAWDGKSQANFFTEISSLKRVLLVLNEWCDEKEKFHSSRQQLCAEIAQVQSLVFLYIGYRRTFNFELNT